jgi:hypothetical protein
MKVEARWTELVLQITYRIDPSKMADEGNRSLSYEPSVARNKKPNATLARDSAKGLVVVPSA